MLIGIIAEEQNDIDVLNKITAKLIQKQQFAFKYFIGHGCGRVRRKCSAWATNLLKRGCNHIVIIHDLDENDEKQLRDEIDSLIRSVALKAYLILIPVKEIEAWLLADSEAIRKAFSMDKTPKVPKAPEKVLRPKENLRDIVWKYSKKRYVNTIHNVKIAEYALIKKLNICESFTPYPIFINKIFKREGHKGGKKCTILT